MRFIYGVAVSILVIISIFPLLTHAKDNSYNNIVFFGDSLSDNGNLYDYDFHYFPKSPPYFMGRFSNGNVWSEYVAQYFQVNNKVTAANYAVGGETAILRDPITNDNLPFSLSESVTLYLTKTLFDSDQRKNTLFIIWIGANDYLSQKNADKLDGITTEVVKSIQDTIERLIGEHGKGFLIINMPNLSKTPYSKEHSLIDAFNAFSLTHNIKLDEKVSQLQSKYPSADIQLYDVNNMFTSAIANPEPYNKKYNTQISNTTVPCWQGTYTESSTGSRSDTQLAGGTQKTEGPQPIQINEEVIAQQLAAHIKNQPQSRSLQPKDFSNKPFENQLRTQDVKAFAKYIASSPALAEAYALGEDVDTDTATFCKNQGNYFFWDHVHPTTIVHLILSKEIISFIQQNYTMH